MEKELFLWGEYEVLGEASIQFHDCVLNRQIGTFNQGSKIDFISIDFEGGVMEFWDSNGIILGQFKLKLEVVGPVEKEEG